MHPWGSFAQTSLRSIWFWGRLSQITLSEVSLCGTAKRPAEMTLPCSSRKAKLSGINTPTPESNNLRYIGTIFSGLIFKQGLSDLRGYHESEYYLPCLETAYGVPLLGGRQDL